MTRSRGYEVVNMGADYSEAEIEWLKAIDRWRRAHDGRTPDCREVLEVARELGYRKPPQENGR